MVLQPQYHWCSLHFAKYLLSLNQGKTPMHGKQGLLIPADLIF